MGDKKRFYGLILFFLVFVLNLNVYAGQGDSLKIRAKTETYNGKYKPQNCVMMWIQKSDQTFIKTIYKAAYRRVQYCKTWDAVSGNAGKTPSDKNWDGLFVDATTGATRSNHNDTMTVIWDCTDRDNKPVASGVYEFWVEMTEDHDSLKNSHGTITIGESSQKVNVPSISGVPFLEATYIPATNPVKQVTAPHQRRLNFTSGKELITFELPQSGNYTVSLLSPAGREITAIKGNGIKAVLPLGDSQLKTGLYLVKISQSGNIYTLPYLKGL